MLQPDKNDLRSIKAEAKKCFSNVSGIQGFGIGKNSLRIYVANQDVASQLPNIFMGVKVDYIIGGEGCIPHFIPA